MTTLQTGRMTATDFWEWANLPENQDKRYELDQGEPVEMPPPGELHGVVCILISHLLTGYVFRRGAGYVCSNDTGLLVGSNPDTLRGPDLMVFLEKRRLEELSRKYVTQVPALIVEVLSPTDQQSKTQKRISQYLRRGVPLVWMVDPEVRSVTVYRPGEIHYLLEEAEDLTGNSVLPDFRCRVADFFTMPGETSPAGT